MNIKAIVTDIEGTTSSIDFVHKVLFPYAAEHLPNYVREHQKVVAVVEQLKETASIAGVADDDIEAIIETLLQWIRDDNKATPLKALQGMIWAHGYEVGDFTGHVYADVAPNLGKWVEQGIALYVYSSGSVPAQKLLFGYSDAGDLTKYFKGYFDTRTGHKREVQSYQAIVTELNLPADSILFLSDIVEELDAASQAGMQTLQLVRDDDVVTGRHASVTDFDQVNV